MPRGHPELWLSLFPLPYSSAVFPFTFDLLAPYLLILPYLSTSTLLPLILPFKPEEEQSLVRKFALSHFPCCSLTSNTLKMNKLPHTILRQRNVKREMLQEKSATMIRSDRQ